MTQGEFQQAAEYWNRKDKDNIKLDEIELLKDMENYIRGNNTCALATGSGSFIRCTPVEYTYHDGVFWIFTEGGQKFVGLGVNKNVCLAIYDRYEGFGRLKGMQVTGTAKIIEPFSKEYIKAAEDRKIPIETLKKMPCSINLIGVIPKRIDYLNSEFKKKGCGVRQFIEF